MSLGTGPIPVLFLAFNRPRLVREQVSRLESADESIRLYVAVDGPRAHRVDDVTAVRECHEILASCALTSGERTLIRTDNLGCGRAVSQAISWFLEAEPCGIILEDDCLPEDEFWPFMRESLDAYEGDLRIGHISGTNFVPEGHIEDPGSRARLSKYPNVWGWATWRNRWCGYQLRGVDATYIAGLERMTRLEKSYWLWAFGNSYSGDIDTWDYQWIAHNWRNRRLSLSSNRNLVRNVGGESGAHATGKHLPPETASLVAADFASLPLCTASEPDILADKWEMRHRFKVGLGSEVRRRGRQVVRAPFKAQRRRLRRSDPWV